MRNLIASKKQKIISSSVPAGPSLWCFVILRDLPSEIWELGMGVGGGGVGCNLPIKKVSERHIQENVFMSEAV